MKLYPLVLSIFVMGLPVFSQTTQSNPEPSSSEAWQSYYMGRTLEGQSRMEEAMPYYNEAVQICLNQITQNTATETSYVVLTWALQRQQKYPDVITWGERGLHLNASNYRLVEIMGEAYFYLDDYDRSLSYMQRYTNVFPQGDRVSTAYFFIGEIFRLRGKFYHADIAYTTAVQLEPNIPLWWYRLGLVQESLREYPLAIAAYERALKLNPTYREARVGLDRTKKVRE